MKKKFTLKKRLIYLGIVLVIGFLFLEGLMIVLEPFLFKGFFQYDQDIGFRVRPGVAATNRFGFLDRDYPLEREPDTYRMLILGDSYGWTGGVHWNYTAILERKFEEKLGDDRVEIINVSYPMTHTGEQLAMLQKYGLQYKPDLVLLGFFAGNDFVDAEPFRKRIVVNDTFVDIDKRSEVVLFGYPLIFKSRLFLFLKQKIRLLNEFAFRKAENPEEIEEEVKVSKASFFSLSFLVPSLIGLQVAHDRIPPRPPDSNDFLFNETTYLSVEFDRLNFCGKKVNEDGFFDDSIQYILESITQMKDLLDQKNIQFLVAIYPDEFQVNEDLLEKIYNRYNVTSADFEICLPQRLLKERLDQLDVPWIDFTEEFRREYKQKPLFKLGDPHWNNAGNDLAAEILFRELPKYIEIP